MGVLTSPDFAGDSRLERCATEDAWHIMPRSRGDHVGKVQQALISVGGQSIDAGELKAKYYGSSTEAAVSDFKSAQVPPLLNYNNEIDSITGKKTIKALDRLLSQKPPPKPVPPPDPQPDPPPIVGMAGLNVGPLGPLRKWVDIYYQQCGLETVPGGQINTGRITYFETFEDLLDNLIKRQEKQQVIVNHGNRVDGLRMPMTAKTRANQTGMYIGYLSELADSREKGLLKDSDFGVKNAADFMKIDTASVMRLVDKLVAVRKKKLVLHFRACTLGANPGMVADYKRAMGAVLTTSHTSRLLFLHVKPKPFDGRHNLSEASKFRSNKRDRHRIFEDPIGLLSPLIFEVSAVEGDPSISVQTFLEDPTPQQVGGWAEFMVRQWRPMPTGDFVVPVMWETQNDTSFSTPLEAEWSAKLVIR